MQPQDYDALALPGGTGSADKLRLDEGAVAFARHFGTEEKPVTVMCHGAWILTDADVVSDPSTPMASEGPAGAQN